MFGDIQNNTMDAVEITTPDGVYIVKKRFVDEIYKMSKSRFSLLPRKFIVSDGLIIAMAIEENAIIERRDVI